MNLHEYLKDMGIRQIDFSRKTKLSKGTIYNICRGRDFLLSVAHAVIVASEGKVTYEDMMDLVLATQTNKPLIKKNTKGEANDNSKQ